jgi:rhodanese-related sulfurtransferase
MQVALFLEHQGFGDVYNLTGGVDAWARQVDPAMPTY